MKIIKLKKDLKINLILLKLINNIYVYHNLYFCKKISF